MSEDMWESDVMSYHDFISEHNFKYELLAQNPTDATSYISQQEWQWYLELAKISMLTSLIEVNSSVAILWDPL